MQNSVWKLLLLWFSTNTAVDEYWNKITSSCQSMWETLQHKIHDGFWVQWIPITWTLSDSGILDVTFISHSFTHSLTLWAWREQWFSILLTNKEFLKDFISQLIYDRFLVTVFFQIIALHQWPIGALEIRDVSQIPDSVNSHLAADSPILHNLPEPRKWLISKRQV